jgi:hypothetical protein
MKGLLNLRGISGQIAALVVVSIAALHLIITASFCCTGPTRRSRRPTAATASLQQPCSCSAQRPPRNGRG